MLHLRWVAEHPIILCSRSHGVQQKEKTEVKLEYAGAPWAYKALANHSMGTMPSAAILRTPMPSHACAFSGWASPTCDHYAITP